MSEEKLRSELNELKYKLKGDLHTDKAYRILYATDASAYREIPVAVARPRDKEDIVLLVDFARNNKLSLIPRAAGTSLAGQVVGSGIVVDISRYMNKILEINAHESWIRVEPGVVLDEMNKALEPYGLFFGPETSTSSRCMLGGMVGNNACGAHSILYGSTRDHTLEILAVLSDGSEVKFSSLSPDEFKSKCQGNSLESNLYLNIRNILSDPENQQEIIKEYPHPSIKRRNTGYAIDMLLQSKPFSEGGPDFNFCTLLAGSEGTLALISEIKLNLVPLPPKEKVLICAHFHTLEEALEGNLVALKNEPGAVELMDKFILDCTKDNIEQSRNRFFIEADPGAILIIEYARENKEELQKVSNKLIEDFKNSGLGYSFPVISGPDIPKVWALRKAGLGVLSNTPGDAKPVSVIEDTAVRPADLPGYIAEFKSILARHGLESVYHAHIATGELHLRPLLNLKDPEDVELFRIIAHESAKLVKKYKGSFSGEHGDGRLRGEFIPILIGRKNYSLLKSIKNTWDPDNIFNPGKIIDTPVMNTCLRYEPGKAERTIPTYFDFSSDGGILRAAERCNGSGDCRKTELIGGTMCPSFMAMRDENTTTRARANTLREFLTNSSQNDDPFDRQEIYDIMDLCLSCKGCKAECPSNIDITKYKAEFLQHYYDKHGVPLRTKAIAWIAHLNRLGMLAPAVYNFLLRKNITSRILKELMGFAPSRSIPVLAKASLKRWAGNMEPVSIPGKGNNIIYLFADEFTDFNDTEIGIKAIHLLKRLGYQVIIPKHTYSGRTFLSKGLLKKARKFANRNVLLLKDIISDRSPLLGIEPSGILTFRDEYPELVDNELRESSRILAASCLMVDEFIAREFESGRIDKHSFTKDKRRIKLHGHCHQKALASTLPTKKMLSIPENYSVEEISSGCCGMAGSFGYEKEHYDLSMKIGELILFPEVRNTPEDIIISAPGTSCRHQIMDGTGRKALHPVEILYEALL
jgi:FAD/FMN-containing dehydrogenase/Fe-S oxidoreductase